MHLSNFNYEIIKENFNENVVIILLNPKTNQPICLIEFILKNDKKYHAIWYDTFEKLIIQYLTTQNLVKIINTRPSTAYVTMYNLELTTSALLQVL